MDTLKELEGPTQLSGFGSNNLHRLHNDTIPVSIGHDEEAWHPWIEGQYKKTSTSQQLEYTVRIRKQDILLSVCVGKSSRLPKAIGEIKLCFQKGGVEKSISIQAVPKFV